MLNMLKDQTERLILMFLLTFLAHFTLNITHFRFDIQDSEFHLIKFLESHQWFSHQMSSNKMKLFKWD